MKQYDYISWSGGGMHGLTYIGVIKAMQDELGGTRAYTDYLARVKGFAGTSIGAVVALTMVLHMNADEVEAVLNPYVCKPQRIAPHLDINRFIAQYGLDNGDAVRSMVAELLQQVGLCKTTTLGDLRRLLRCELSICTTNLQTGLPRYLSSETTPQLQVIEAVFMSLCLPVVYAPAKFEGGLYVDGALTENVPLCYQDRANSLYVVFEQNERKLVIEQWSDYIEALVRLNAKQTIPHVGELLTIYMPQSLCEMRIAPRDLPYYVTRQLISMGYASFQRFIDPRVADVLTGVLKMAVVAFLTHLRYQMRAVVDGDDVPANGGDQCT